MTKKILAAILTLSLSLSMATAAFAAEENKKVEGSGTIKFTDETEEGIVDPSKVTPDPEKPGDTEDLGKIDANLNLDFGTQEIDDVNDRTYLSSKQDSYAGFLVRSKSDTGWQATVSISKFMIGTGETAKETISGFSLTLKPVKDEINKEKDTEYNPAVIEFNPKTVTIPAGIENEAVIATGKRGVAGINYEGELKVLRATAHEGDAQATLDWTYMVNP